MLSREGICDFMSRVNLNRSNSVDLSQPQDVPVQSNLASRLRRPRTDSFHNVPAPLSNAPNRSQQAYKEALRYHPKETKRIVAQKTVDRLTQKNLSRNVKETLTQGNKFWNKRRFWDRKGTDIKGKVGLSTPATKLKQLTLHRQRDQLMASINSSKHKLWLLSDKESDRTFFDNVRYGNQQPQIEKLELLREMDVPEDFRLEFKEEFCNQYNQNAQNPIDDPADLNWRMQKDPQVKQQFDSFFDTQFWNRLGNHYRLNDRPEEAQRCLANDSQQWRTDQLAAAKQHVGNQLEESEFHNELTSM